LLKQEKRRIGYGTLSCFIIWTSLTGTPLGSELLSFSELPGGLARGHNFDSDSARKITRVFGRKPVENIRKACEALGLCSRNPMLTFALYFHFCLVTL